MKSACVKSTMVLLVLGLLFAATPALGQLQDFHVIGSGTVETNCLATLEPGCTITASGVAEGALISGPESSGSFILRLDTGSPVSLNGYSGAGPVAVPQGVCVPASFHATLTAANGDIISFSHAGIVCEEAGPGSPYLYNGTYRISGGTGQFTAAAGGGSLTSTFTREGARVFLDLRGVVSY